MPYYIPMTLFDDIWENRLNEYFLKTFMILITSLMTLALPQSGRTMEFQSNAQYQTALSDWDISSLTMNKIALPLIQQEFTLPALSDEQVITFSGNIHSFRENGLLSTLITSLKKSELATQSGLGMTGYVKLPVITGSDWAIHLHGKLISSLYLTSANDQIRRWNIEYQLGWDANFTLSEKTHLSFQLYQSRIVNKTQFDRSSQNYINSVGGSLSVNLLF